MRKILSFAAVLAILPMAACSSARVVSMEPGEGGQVALSARDSDGAREKAANLMAQNCAGHRYKVVKEGEEVVGSKTSSTSGKSIWSKSLRSTSSDTDNKTEWRMTYKCLN